MPRTPLTVAVTLGAGVFALLMATAPGHLFSVDGLAYYRTATTLAWDQSLFLDPPMVWGWIAEAPLWPIGLSLVQLPAALLVAPLRDLQPAFDPALPNNFDLIYRDPVYALMSWVNPLVVAGVAAATYYLATVINLTRRSAFFAALAATLFGPLFFYARADFAQPLSALMLVMGMAVLFRYRSEPRTRLLIALVPIGALAVLTRPVDGALTVAAWLVVAMWPTGLDSDRREAWRPVVATLAAAAVGLALSLLVNQVRRGSWFHFGYQGFGLDAMDPAMSLAAYLASPGRGILWHFPLLVVVPAGALFLWRSSRKLESAALGLPIILWTAAYALWLSLGDNSYGPRFLIPAIPTLGILAAASLEEGTRLMRRLFGVTALLGLLFNLPLMATDQLGYWGIRGPNHTGTEGFWRQFELGAFAPIGTLERLRLSEISRTVDVFWLKMWGESGSLTAAIMLGLVIVGLALLARAWRLSSARAV